MTVLIAPDKFKGSLTARQVCQAIEEGLRSVDSSLMIISLPLADGGEGTGGLLTELSGGFTVKVKVCDPLFREIESEYGISSDGKTAFIEMAKASGLQLLAPEDRNPLHTSTIGTGQLIIDALERGVNQVILAVGGSATNDAGIGMADALGFSFWSATNEKLKPVGRSLIHIDSIHSNDVHPLLSKTEFTVISDVDNLLFGEQGAAYIFGGQKGANAIGIELLDRGLRQFNKIAEATFNTNVNFPGAGAGGGIGAGAKIFLKAQASGGFDFISRHTKLEDKIILADLVITGEGKIDLQTLSGKVVKGVADLASRHQKHCIAFTGVCDLPLAKIPALKIQEIISLSDDRIGEKESMTNAFSILKERSAAYFRRRNS